MSKKILIIGKNSFIAQNLYSYLIKKAYVKKIKYYDFFKKSKNYIIKFDYIINCTSNKNYISKKYNTQNDHDYLIAKKISDLKTSMIFFSTRKIYRPKYGIKENDLIQLKCHYSKNKYKSEKKLRKLLDKKLTILRISNVIGFKKKSKRSIHKTFVDIFFENIKKGNVLKISNEYKDFLTIKDLCNVIYRVIRYNLNGTYNVSLGKKIYLKRIIEWLNYYNQSKFKIINMKKYHNNDSFTLNNKKLLKRINIKISINKLEKECKEISKNFFRKK